MSTPTDWMNGWIASEEAGNDTIAVKKIYIDVNEDNLFDGVLFSQIMYWHGKSRETGKSRLSVFRDGHYWLAKSYDDWKEECRIVGSTARKCIRRIAARGLIIVKLYKFGGFPTVHIRVNWDVLESRIKSIRPVVSKGIDTTGQKGLIPQVKSITDTTPENTVTPPNPRKRGNKGEKSSARQVTVERYNADPIAIQLNAKFGNDIAANNMTIKAMQHFMDAAVDLSAIGYTPEQIKPALKIMDSKAENWSHGYGLDGFMRYAADILKQIQRKKQPALVSDTRPFIPMLYQAAIERGEMTEAEVLNIMSGGAA